MEKFEYIKAMGFDGYEIDGRLLVENLDEVSGYQSHRPAGHDGLWRIRWLIGDFIEERRLNGLQQIERILEALAEVGGKGLSFRLPGDVYLPSAANDFAT